ncbi:pyroglutamyl-peptidase I [Ignavigranum ruoffiae]|uniref:Pyrrolidone-carboxylate peptidase n=1 Tax=Ignavigranum ruoffiae TaxID=89093 RepID=A0A1H9BIM9_9LACT|nr:pyroglutamyl-peptidase I [Ignavigranum ruoffiae]SEP88860.1 pyroglutamyl-peptidase I Cysteine peptidase. MEROPS family C15 [Ignavigranum ruoffiae]
MKILLTAFDPFGNESINPALEAVKKVNPDHIDAEIVKLEVPTVFHKAIEVVADKIRSEQPDVVLAIGQAGGRYEITPERVAINQDDARIEDNEGNQPIDVPIFEDGQAAYFASVPIKAMVEEVKAAGVPASVSNSAGTFVCNHLMYGILYTLAKELPEARGGFVHVPFIPEQVVNKPNQPSMALADITKGIEACLQAIVANDQDIKKEGGAIA